MDQMDVIGMVKCKLVEVFNVAEHHGFYLFFVLISLPELIRSSKSTITL